MAIPIFNVCKRNLICAQTYWLKVSVYAVFGQCKSMLLPMTNELTLVYLIQTLNEFLTTLTQILHINHGFLLNKCHLEKCDVESKPDKKRIDF